MELPLGDPTSNMETSKCLRIPNIRTSGHDKAKAQDETQVVVPVDGSESERNSSWPCACQARRTADPAEDEESTRVPYERALVLSVIRRLWKRCRLGREISGEKVNIPWLHGSTSGGEAIATPPSATTLFWTEAGFHSTSQWLETRDMWREGDPRRPLAKAKEASGETPVPERSGRLPQLLGPRLPHRATPGGSAGWVQGAGVGYWREDSKEDGVPTGDGEDNSPLTGGQRDYYKSSDVAKTFGELVGPGLARCWES
ncbi:hypothetical protein VTK73DRAFT_9235 [Phialemonium thermophilum]|uniref:Uncharacterized protein n=1 Tax=Phialemonium thermophilum TaxID=223376 RepID=A0ABR3W3K4_9PEZI